MEAINFLGIGGVAAIVVICWMIGLVVKASGINNKWIPVICGLAGAILGAVALFCGMPDFPASDYFNAVAIGIVSGLGSVGCHQIYKQLTGIDNSGQALEIDPVAQRMVAAEVEAIKAEQAEETEKEMEE